PLLEEASPGTTEVVPKPAIGTARASNEASPLHRPSGAVRTSSLRVLQGPRAGDLIPLDGDRFVLGRNPDCGIVIPATSVSREHAQILRLQGKYFIEDKQSRNGTFVNNQAINARTALKNNDRIRICDFIAAFLDQPPDPDQADDEGE